ncbi:MAG: CsgG/HfaB family protein [Spirochaetia bacterium]|nr:CsgG/HfaB family protein [Spirochaetia bacterium]
MRKFQKKRFYWFSRYLVGIILAGMAVYPCILSAADGQGASRDEKLINRKVLILNFVNTRNSTDYAYLENSIPDSFLDPLDRTKSFEMLPRSIWEKLVADSKFKKEDAYKEDAAIEAGKFSGADVVIIGSFAALTDKVQIFAKAIELSSGRVMVSRTSSAPLDNTMFDSINKLTTEMTSQMKEKLPPLPQKTITVEREKYVTKMNVTYGGMVWRTLLVPGLGHVYANQWRGWVYMPLWAGTAGAFVYGVINESIQKSAYVNASSGLEAKYTAYDNARLMRNFSLLAVLGVYAVTMGDILITGNAHTTTGQTSLNNGVSMLPERNLEMFLTADLDGFRADIQKKW